MKIFTHFEYTLNLLEGWRSPEENLKVSPVIDEDYWVDIITQALKGQKLEVMGAINFETRGDEFIATGKAIPMRPAFSRKRFNSRVRTKHPPTDPDLDMYSDRLNS